MTILDRIPYTLLMILSATISGVIALRAYQSRRKVARAASFSMMAACGSLWMLLVTLDTFSASLFLKEILWRLMPFAILNTLTALFFFSLEFSLRLKSVPRAVLISVLPVQVAVTLLSIGNHLHHQMWTVAMVNGYPVQVMGQFFPIQLALTYLLASGSLVLLVRAFLRSKDALRRQTGLLLVGISIPLVVSILSDVFGWNPLPYVDEPAFSILFAVIFFGWATLRFNTFYLLPVASDLIIKNMLDGVLVTDVDGLVIFSNAAAQQALGRTEAQLQGHAAGMVLKEWLPEAYQAWAGGKQDVQLILGGQPAMYFRLTISLLAGNSGEAIGSLITLYNITRQKVDEIRLNELAISDPLTGSYNRRYFYEMAHTYIEQAQRTARSLSILMLDLDHFKQINDTYGHVKGDLVLQKVVAACKSLVRPADIFSRFGGEEFVLAMPETSLRDALVIAERLRRVIEALKDDLSGMSITASLGVADSGGDPGVSLDELLRRADEAMYASKHAGRNRVTAWQADD
ncbi:MAG: diguanylate cyclase [Chloroflexi bacterium]|nr:diguanylate cyclase [Chloroflexota bacterium]